MCNVRTVKIVNFMVKIYRKLLSSLSSYMLPCRIAPLRRLPPIATGTTQMGFSGPIYCQFKTLDVTEFYLILEENIWKHQFSLVIWFSCFCSSYLYCWIWNKNFNMPLKIKSKAVIWDWSLKTVKFCPGQVVL